MAISVTCTLCGSKLNAPDNSAGLKLKCPKCGGQFVAKPPGQSGFAAHAAGPRGSKVAAAQGNSSRAAWYCTRGKQRVGPLSWAQLQQMAASGQLKGSDMILQAGTERWLPAASAKGLFAAGKPSGFQPAGRQIGARASSSPTNPRVKLTPPRGVRRPGGVPDETRAQRRIWPWLALAAAVLLVAGGAASMLALDPLGWRKPKGGQQVAGATKPPGSDSLTSGDTSKLGLPTKLDLLQESQKAMAAQRPPCRRSGLEERGRGDAQRSGCGQGAGCTEEGPGRDGRPQETPRRVHESGQRCPGGQTLRRGGKGIHGGKPVRAE